MIRNLRIAAVHFALAAMVLRALTPAGWMPNMTGVAGTPLLICTMNGPVQLSLGPDGNPLKQEPASHHHEACPFAAMPPLAQVANAAELALPSEASAPAPKVMYRASAAVAARHTPQSPRAPPRFA